MNKAFILLLLLPAYIVAQKSNTIHPTILGARFNLVDFNSKKPFGTINKMIQGLGFSLVKGIGNHFDWNLSIDGFFSDSAMDSKLTKKKLLFQLEFGIRARMFYTERKFQPYLSSGMGFSIYNNNFNTYIPLGMGLQIALFPEAYVLVQAQYRVSVPQNINNHYLYSIGFSGSIAPSRKKNILASKKIIFPPVIPLATDRDYDGIPDTVDACPDIPGMALFVGCPDRDSDGIPDKEDNCPDVFGFTRYMGCPVPDSDKDGINDEEDSCVVVFGSTKHNGCPAPDIDQDSIPDEEDKCPEIAGTLLNNGCPEIKKEVTATINKAAKNILFATGSYRLLGVSYKSLDEVVQILKGDTLIKVSIEGHTDNVGRADKNQLLSEQRAKAVMAYLTEKGIAGDRLKSLGYGIQNPLTTNTTPEGRTINRRVEFILGY